MRLGLLPKPIGIQTHAFPSACGSKDWCQNLPSPWAHAETPVGHQNHAEAPGHAKAPMGHQGHAEALVGHQDSAEAPVRPLWGIGAMLRSLWGYRGFPMFCSTLGLS